MEDPAGGLAGQGDLGRDRAGFWRRFVAAFIDGLVVGVVQFIFNRAVGGFLASLVGLVVSAAYFTYFHGRTGQTPGDAALGVKVIDLQGGTGQLIGYPRAFLRWLVSIVSGLALLVGFLWMLWDDEKQTWHDKAAGSVVVKLGS
jgi:uncharacterized RDD family membrane protein YckC